MIRPVSGNGIDRWWSGGERWPCVLSDVERSIFVRQDGSGPWMTLLHGFPSCSYDWAQLVPALRPRHALLMPDLLGFGASEKPLDHDYSIREQADLVEALWRHAGVTSSVIVAHDYSVSVTQELLARRADGALAVDLVAVWLLNGGLYPDLHRPEAVQTALLDPEQGPRINAAMTSELMAAALRPTFAEHFDARASSEAIWVAASRGGAVLHRLIHYMVDRREHEARWVDALEHTDVPLAFVWGMLDPISGAHVAARVRERLPDAPFTALADVAHWPPLEAPERVLDALTLT